MQIRELAAINPLDDLLHIVVYKFRQTEIYAELKYNTLFFLSNSVLLAHFSLSSFRNICCDEIKSYFEDSAFKLVSY